MELHNQELYQEALQHFNEPVISDYHMQVGRLIGYSETGVDCYFIIRLADGKLTYNSCVGGTYWLSSLREQGKVVSTQGENWDDLYRIDSSLGYNGCPKEPEFMLKIDHSYMELKVV